MEQYTIYCTEEQAKNALELSAPIFHMSNNMTINGEGWFQYNGLSYSCPTAEQMLGWLIDKGFRFKIAVYADNTYWQYYTEPSCRFGCEIKYGSYLCYKDAVLSLIDEALDYLLNRVV